MQPQIYHVNAFCGEDAGGNPGAVCILESERPVAWMQAVASQMNLSETGFVLPLASGGYALRWFSPVIEIPLCGHVTLAAAHVLWNDAQLADGETVRFQTASGWLEARRRLVGIEIDLPLNPCSDIRLPSWLLDSLEVKPKRVLAGNRKYLVELAAEIDVLNMRPNFDLLRHAADRGVIVTARSTDSRYDVVSRYFASYVGVDEDPVTGSAHCCLVPYWSEKLRQPVIRARQASLRGGELTGRVEGERVALTGKARTVLSGTLLI